MLAGMRRRGWVSLLAAALTLPAVLFVAANILKHGVGADGLSAVLGPFAEPGDGGDRSHRPEGGHHETDERDSNTTAAWTAMHCCSPHDAGDHCMGNPRP